MTGSTPIGAQNSRSLFQSAALTLLCAALIGLGLYILSGYLHALTWALVLAVALWPTYRRARAHLHSRFGAEVAPILFTLLVGLFILLPVGFLAVEAARELKDLIDYAKSAEETGVPVPEFLARSPVGGAYLAEWWSSHLSHAGWAKELAARFNTASTRELGRHVGANAVHRLMLLFICMLTLFFLLRDGDHVVAASLVASRRLFGEKGERVALQMVSSVHGTVNGLVLVALGEGALLGLVYFFVHVPHPILFAAFTAVAAMIPFAAAVAIGLAALLLAGSGSAGAALIVISAGLLVTFVADHFVRPQLIGGATRLPFIWVLLGILGGVETFALLGLFLGPAVMSALILLWRDFTEDDPSCATPPVQPSNGPMEPPTLSGPPERAAYLPAESLDL